MGKGAANKQQVSEFTMSIHSGLCVGPVDAITGLFVGEKLAWEGEVTDEAAIYVNAPSLFGGPKDGGGVGGVMYYLPGGPMQVMPDQLAARQGLTSNTSPAYRGICSVYFVGLDGVPTGSIDTSGDTGGDGGTGSGGTGGGGGGEPPDVGGDGNCVAEHAWMPDGRKARDVEVGDRLLAVDYATLSSTTVVEVRHTRPAVEQCVRLTSASGIRLTCSRHTPVTLRDGSEISVLDCIGKCLPVQDENGFRWETIRVIELVGEHAVARIDAGGATYAAGDEPGRFIFTHNLRKAPT